MLQRVPRKSHCERLKPAILTLVSRNSAHKKVTNLRFAKSLIKEKNPREIHLLTFPRFISYACCDWLLPYNRCSDVTNTTLHKVYQTGQGETDSEEAANDRRLLRIVQEYKLCSFARFPFSADDHEKSNRNSNPFLRSVILVKYLDNQIFSIIYISCIAFIVEWTHTCLNFIYFLSRLPRSLPRLFDLQALLQGRRL